MPVTNAVDAGWLGISEKTCLEKGMCWKKWNGPWCYKPYGQWLFGFINALEIGLFNPVLSNPYIELFDVFYRKSLSQEKF